MRVVAALVLAPLTVVIAWIGGWPWACIVTAAGALLYVEWLTIVGASRNRPVVAAGISALVIAGILLMIGRTDIAVAVLAAGAALAAFLASEQRYGSPAA